LVGLVDRRGDSRFKDVIPAERFSQVYAWDKQGADP
jgi:hypothetical protein